MNRLPWMVLSAALLVPAVAWSGAPADPVARAVQSLGAHQRDYEGAAASWSWKRGDARPAANTAGLVALGLATGGRHVGDPAAIEAARAYADARLADLAAWRPLYDPDIEALAAVAAATGEARYLDAAREGFNRRWGEAEGVETVARLHQVRKGAPALVGFDVALAMRAAVAVGRDAFARDLADALLKHWPSWSRPVKNDAKGFATVSRAAFLTALVELDPVRYAGAIGTLSKGLVAVQGDDGSWAFRNTQATAYAVRALARVGGAGKASAAATDPAAARSAAAAALLGASWLESTQLKDGSWATFHDGLPEPFVGDVIHEVTAEATLALMEARS